MDFFSLLVLIVVGLIILMFLSYLLRSRTSRYDDWVREERRKEMLEVVRTVRAEKGDYAVPRVSSKKAAPRARTSSRRRK